MTQENRIPVSRAVRWQRIRYRAIPVLSFIVAIVASSWLWRNYGGMAQGVGEVDSPRVDITSPTAGLVMSLPHEARGQWLIYDHVQAGEVIARVEDQQLEHSKNLVAARGVEIARRRHDSGRSGRGEVSTRLPKERSAAFGNTRSRG